MLSTTGLCWNALSEWPLGAKQCEVELLCLVWHCEWLQSGHFSLRMPLIRQDGCVDALVGINRWSLHASAGRDAWMVVIHKWTWCHHHNWREPALTPYLSTFVTCSSQSPGNLAWYQLWESEARWLCLVCLERGLLIVQLCLYLGLLVICMLHTRLHTTKDSWLLMEKHSQDTYECYWLFLCLEDTFAWNNSVWTRMVVESACVHCSRGGILGSMEYTATHSRMFLLVWIHPEGSK